MCIRDRVKTEVDEALVYLQGKMNSNCQFGSSEAGAQVLIALSSLGKDPLNQDNGFVKSVARNLVTGLDAYRIESKGFKHMLTDSTPNAMATQQALLALESCRRLKAREASIYDITDFNARKTLEKRVAEAEALKEEDVYKRQRRRYALPRKPPLCGCAVQAISSRSVQLCPA